MKRLFFFLVVAYGCALSSCDQHPYSHLTVYRSGNNYWRTFAWTYDGHNFISTFFIPIEIYNYYRALSKNQAFSEYVTEHPDHRYLQSVCRTLYENIEDYHYSDKQIQEYLLAFSQSVPYAYDPLGSTNYPRYPAETLAEDEGDCKTHAVLYLSLLTAYGYKGILLEPPGHLAVGLACNWCNGSYVELSGVRYYYVETTSKNWPIGAVPREFIGAHPIVFTVSQTASFKRPIASSRQYYTNKNIVVVIN